MKYITIVLVLMGYMYASGSHGGGHDNMNMGGKKMPHWAAPKNEVNKKNPIHYSKKSVNKGKQLFKANCASCHGINADGKGSMAKHLKTIPANLIKMSNSHKDGDFFWKIATGKGEMPSFKNTISKNDIWDLVNFIQSLSKKTVSHH